MNTRNRLLPHAFILASVLGAIYGCDSNPVDAGSPKLITGPGTDLTVQVVSPAGGIVTVGPDVDTLGGMRIEVPNGAYSEARTYRISYAPIVNHEFGPEFTPISPLITISNGGGDSDKPMLVTIPVNVPAGKFAMAYLYDETRGELEGLPIVESTGDHVTVMTRTFAHSTVHSLGKRVAGSNMDGEAKYVMTASDPATEHEEAGLPRHEQL